MLELWFALQIDEKPTLLARVYVWGDVDVLRRHLIFVEELDGDFGVVEMSFLRSEGVDPTKDAEAMASALLLSGVKAFGCEDDPGIRRPVCAIHWNPAPVDHTISPVGACR